MALLAMTQASIDPKYAPFIQIAQKPSKSRQKSQAEAIEQFIGKMRGQLARVKRKEAKLEVVPDQFKNERVRTTMAGYNQIINSIKTEIAEYEATNLQKIIDFATEVERLALKHTKYIVDIDNLVQQLTDSCKKNNEYVVLKRRKRSLTLKLERVIARSLIPNYLNLLRSEILQAMQKYQPDIQYSPPSEFDNLIIEYIFHSSLGEMAIPTATIIAEGEAEAAIYTIGEFALAVYNQLNITNENSQAVIYTSLIRFLFEQAYVLRPELNKYQTQNLIFIAKCQEFGRQTVRDLRLADGIVKDYTLGLPISSLFKSKQVDLLKQMEIMTNPIDLMKHVHTILGALTQYFGSADGVLSFDDTLTLLLALTSINPPSNAVAIAKFVEKWSDIQLSSLVGVAKNYFIAAVDHLLTKEELQEKENKNCS